jgi:hypothetical protein
MATLIDSSRNYSHISVLSYTADSAADKFIEAVYRRLSRLEASNRLVIKDGRYMYTPSQEYTNTPGKLIRFKNFKK